MVLNHMDITYDIKGGQVTVEWTFEDKKIKNKMTRLPSKRYIFVKNMRKKDNYNEKGENERMCLY